MERKFFVICGIIVLALHVGCATSVPINVSIDGLYFSDIGCDATKCHVGWEAMARPHFSVGEFGFDIEDINTTMDIERDTQEIKSSNEFR